MLNKSLKVVKNNKQIALGDVVVIVVSNNSQRYMWNKGRVIKLYLAKDRRVRVVDIETCRGRPVSKLCILGVKK